ncbi:MAG: tRNA lysidine(34) synthetase TilS [Pseudomonadota bacterium]
MGRNDGALEKNFSSALSAIIADQIKGNIQNGIAVAYSGGLDSSVLLKLTVDFARARALPVFAFHIHHGLSPNADDWLSHCKSVSEQSGAKFSAIKVSIAETKKGGIEAKARTERYSALGQLCSANSLPLILAAHHQDDQAETVLLQLLRGSGVAGLSGMDLFNYAPTLLGNSETLLARPLLHQSKLALKKYAVENGIHHIEDESNSDPRFTRNAFRHHLMPEMLKISPAYAELISRSAQHAQSAQHLLVELAKLDLTKYLSDGALDIALMRELSPERIDNLLRFWLSSLGVRMPSTARLTEIRSQLFDARDDAKITIKHDGLEIHRFQDKVHFSSQVLEEIGSSKSVEFIWAGESSMYFPQFDGRLFFDASSYGVDSNWLLGRKLTLRSRHGGERLKLAANRPTRDLKSHFQSLKIPFWQRHSLPILCTDGNLLHASLVGTEASFCREGSSDLINFRWQAGA